MHPRASWDLAQQHVADLRTAAAHDGSHRGRGRWRLRIGLRIVDVGFRVAGPAGRHQPCL
jgi:hypothetical protein